MDRPEAGLQFRVLLDSIGVSSTRGKRGRVSRDDLGRAAKYDSSYISLMSGGRIPPQEGARRMASALLMFGARREDVDLWLWLCGYSLEVSACLRDQMIRARALPAYQQRKLAAAMRAAINELRGTDVGDAETPQAPVTVVPLRGPRATTTLSERLRKALR